MYVVSQLLCADVLQCAAACCSVLQCVALCYFVLEGVAEWCIIFNPQLQHLPLLWVISHIHPRVMSHIWMSHVTHMNASCHTQKWVMSCIETSRVTHMQEVCHTYEWVMSHICMSHVTYVTSHVTHMNETCHTKHIAKMCAFRASQCKYKRVNVQPITAYCIWSLISSISNLNQYSNSISLFCHVSFKRDQEN